MENKLPLQMSMFWDSLRAYTYKTHTQKNSKYPLKHTKTTDFTVLVLVRVGFPLLELVYLRAVCNQHKFVPLRVPQYN